ncbi:MAG: hypothetical protein PUH44_03775 [Bacteroidales bacterium]|nr:hypothetical protein [Bacteroidales bacterium]MDY2705394.1 hypothetical protein [Alloprevotella sp.]
MKKIQLILLLVLLAITGQVGAQIIPTTITNGQFDPGTVFYRINFTPSIFQHYYITIGSDVTTTTKSKATLFAFVGNNTDGYRIYAKGDATKYIYLTSTTSDVNVDNVHYGTSDTYDKFKIRKNGSGYTIYQYGPRSSSIPTSLNYVSGSTLQTWSNSESLSDNNCRVAFEAVEMSLLYQYTFSEGTVNQVVYGTIGSAYPNATAPAFCTITGSKPAGKVTAGGTETATFNATWDGPLDYSSDLANAKWYLMTLGYEESHKQVFRYSTLNTTINLPTDAYTFTYSSKDQFAFVGNPLDGFQVINRSAGNPRLVANADGTGNPTFANSPSSAQSDRWDIYNVTVGPASSITVPGDKRFGLNLHGYSAKKLNRSGSTRNVVYWGDHDNGSTFTVSQADLPSLALNVFDGKTYASFYVDYPVEVTSENVKVYTGTVSGNTLQMTEANDKIIPANVGVVLVGNTASETSTALSIANSAGTVAHGVITGSITDVPIQGYQDQYLVLGLSNQEPQSVGFFQPTVATIPAYRAYIPKSATQSVRGLYFNFDGETTSIDPTVLTPAKEETIYDLSGRRVNKTVKGIYIKNGKKIYVK